MTTHARVSDAERAILELLVADCDAFHSAIDLARHAEIPAGVAQDALRRLTTDGLLSQSWVSVPGSGKVFQPIWHPTDAGRDALAKGSP